MEQKIQLEQNFEPIRGSITILAMKLLAMLFIFEGLYVGLFYILNIAFSLPFDWHHHSSVVLLSINGLKILLEFLSILYLFFQWAGISYFITRKHVIKRVGIINNREEIFHFDNIRSITVKQLFLGKIFNYGDIEIKVSASGGYQGDVILSGIAKPNEYETKLKAMF